MPIVDAKKRRIGRELVDWIHLGIRTGARRSVANYRTGIALSLNTAKYTEYSDAEIAAGRTPDTNSVWTAKIRAQAIGEITRAVNMPRRARERINEWIRAYDLANGAGAGQTFIGECLTLAGSVTLGEINIDLTTLETQADTLIANNTGGGTLDEMATAIENAMDNEANQWVFPFPDGYEDIVLLDN